MKPEQRLNADDTHALKMPRQGVSFLNDMLDHGGTPHETHPPPKTWNNVNMPTVTRKAWEPFARDPGLRHAGVAQTERATA